MVALFADLRDGDAEGYFRYVDDILVIYKDDKTNIHRVLEDFNNLVPSIKFTLEKEQNNRMQGNQIYHKTI